MADRIDPSQFRIVKGLGVRMRDLPEADPSQFRVVKGLGVKMRDLPAKRTEGLHSRTNSTPANNTNNPDRKAKDQAQSDGEQE